MTTTQKNAISSPAVGLVVYQTDGTEGLYEYTSGGWERLSTLSTSITDIKRGEYLYYDPTQSTFVNGSETMRRKKIYEYWEDFNTASVIGTLNGRLSGTGSAAARTTFAAMSTFDKPYRPGVIGLFTGTTSTGYASVDMQTLSAFGPFIYAGENTGQIEFVSSFLFTVLATSVDDYVFYTGYHSDARTTEPTHGIYFKYDRSVYGDSLVLVSANNGTRSEVTTSISITANEWNNVKWKLNDDATELRAYVNDVEITAVSGTYPITTNIPATASIGIYPYSMMKKTAGTTSRVAYLDYIGMSQVIIGNR
jgi:hypothetical protein